MLLSNYQPCIRTRVLYAIRCLQTLVSLGIISCYHRTKWIGWRQNRPTPTTKSAETVSFQKKQRKTKSLILHEVGIDHDVNDTHVCLNGLCGQLPWFNRVLDAKLRGIMRTFEQKADIDSQVTVFLSLASVRMYMVYILYEVSPCPWISTFAAVSGVFTVGEPLGLVSGSAPTCLRSIPSVS